MKYDTGARKYKRTQSGIALGKSLSNLEISMGTHLPHLYCLYLGQAYTAHCFLLSSKPIAVVLGFIIAQFLVDFVSGMLHWACDTWGRF